MLLEEEQLLQNKLECHLIINSNSKSNYGKLIAGIMKKCKFISMASFGKQGGDFQTAELIFVELLAMALERKSTILSFLLRITPHKPLL